MMVYVSISNKIEKLKVEKILKELDFNEVIDNENELIIDSSDKIKKSKIVICDYDIDKIKKYLSEKKKVIIYKETIKKIKKDEEILYKKDVYTYSKKNELREILHFIKSREKLKKSIINLLIFIIILLIILSLLFIKINSITIINNKTNILEKEQENKKEKSYYAKENIVFYGDSITDFYNLEKFYPNIPVVNSGTSGFQTKDLLRLMQERVYIYNPSKVFILIGTNDIAFTDLTNEEIVANIKEIVDDIKENRSLAKIYIESIYPVNRNTDNDVVDISMVGGRENERIQNINILIKNMADNEKIEYIDMYDELLDENDDLKLEYTIDGLHMTDAGYEVITKKIMEYIDPSTKEE